MRLYDGRGMLCDALDFADRFPPQGQPVEAPVRLALITRLQFMEGLTNQAIDAVRTRIDWKCATRRRIGWVGCCQMRLSSSSTRNYNPENHIWHHTW